MIVFMIQNNAKERQWEFKALFICECVDLLQDNVLGIQII